MYAGLDLSLSSTGVCLLAYGGRSCATFSLGSKAKGAERLTEISQNLMQALYTKLPDLACIEGYAMGAVGQTFSLGELGGVVRCELYRFRIPYIVATPQQLKMFATGRGNADKIEVAVAVAQLWGVDFLKDNPKNKPDWGTKEAHWRNDEADAYVLARIAEAYKTGNVANAYQEQVIQKIKQDPTGVLSHAAKEKLKQC